MAVANLSIEKMDYESSTCVEEINRLNSLGSLSKEDFFSLVTEDIIWISWNLTMGPVLHPLSAKEPKSTYHIEQTFPQFDT